MDDEMAALMGFGGFGKKAAPRKSTVTEANLERTKRDPVVVTGVRCVSSAHPRLALAPTVARLEG